MGDETCLLRDHACLFAIASEQQGYFTAAQARDCGFGWDLLAYHARRGRFIRLRRGLYRLRDYPTSRHEEVMAAWLAVGKDQAVISHESALDLLGLSNVIPSAVHVSIPRSRRHLPALPGVTIHTTSRSLRREDVTVREGMRLTSAARSILDAAEVGTAPEQIEMAVLQALERGLATAPQLLQDAGERSQRVSRLMSGALNQAIP